MVVLGSHLSSIRKDHDEALVEFEYYDAVESYGVQVAMPQHDEDDSMEVLVHEVDNGKSNNFSDEDDELISEDEDLRNVCSSQNDDRHDQELALIYRVF